LNYIGYKIIRMTNGTKTKQPKNTRQKQNGGQN